MHEKRILLCFIFSHFSRNNSFFLALAELEKLPNTSTTVVAVTTISLVISVAEAVFLLGGF
jgi:hypothetical protein